MRALYEINADLEALLNNVDEETGELIIDDAALDALLMERTDKLEGVALSVKNINAEIAAIKAEETALADRRKRLEKQRDGRTEYLVHALNGEKLETAKVAIGYRASKAVEIDEAVFMKWAKRHKSFLRIADPAPDKKAITDAIKAGETIPGAALVEKQNISIK